MTMYGANPEQLTNLGGTLNRQIDTITQVMSTVDGVLDGTAWTGPARDQFVEDWNGSFKQALVFAALLAATGRCCGGSSATSCGRTRPAR